MKRFILLAVILALTFGCASVKMGMKCPDASATDQKGVERQEIKLICW